MKDPLHFYHSMTYPIPTPEERFRYDKKTQKKYNTDKKASRSKINTVTKNITKHINHYTTLYQSLPFITHIYLCNSTTFNAPTPHSDIDLTCITKEGRLRTARLYSVLFFWIKGIKRTNKNHKERFCLTFYLTKDHCNLYTIKRPHTDNYLTYWIAHLVPLRTQEGEDPNHLLHENSRIRAQLQNFPPYLPIQLDTQWPTHNNTKTKKILEALHTGRRGDGIERCIKTLRLPIIRYKKKKHKRNHDIITSDTMLKFHYDKRDIIHDALKITTEKQQ